MHIPFLFLALVGFPLVTGLVTVDLKAQTFEIHKDALSHGVADYSNVNK